MQQTSEHTKLQRYKDTKLQRYKATKIHTLTPLTYELFFQNSSKIAQKWRKHNCKHICEVLPIKPMTEGYNDRSPQTIPLKTMYLKNYTRYSFAVFNIRLK